jgi:hypothetical protein
MKILKFAFVMTLMIIGLNSCQKDDEPKEESKSVAGTWDVKWGLGSETPSTYEKWEVKENGDLNAFWPDGALYAVGSWDKNGNEVEAHYTEVDEPLSFTFIGTYDEDADEITGTWHADDDPALGGAFEMKRH